MDSHELKKDIVKGHISDSAYSLADLYDITGEEMIEILNDVIRNIKE